MSWHGRRVITHLTRGEREVEWWLDYSDRLTREERQRIAAGDYSAIVRPIWQTWKKGDWLTAASNLVIQIGETRTKRRGEVTDIVHVRDFRVRRPRRTPGMFEPPETDSAGVPIPHDAAAIAKASEDGNYTASAALGVPEDDDAVPRDYQEQITKEAGERGRLREMVEHPERIVDQDQRRKQNKLRKLQAEARKKGIDITPELDGAIREIQAKLAA